MRRQAAPARAAALAGLAPALLLAFAFCGARAARYARARPRRGRRVAGEPGTHVICAPRPSLARSLAEDAPGWATEHHEPGYCAMYDICGHRADGDPLNCANNTRAAPPSGELALTLQATCPTLWSERGGMNGTYCCTPRQVEVLQNNVRAAAGAGGGGIAALGARARPRGQGARPRRRARRTHAVGRRPRPAEQRAAAQRPDSAAPCSSAAPPPRRPFAPPAPRRPSPPPPPPLQTQRALPFIIGCPACRHNFVHLWCVLTCSPDQAAFTNVSAVQAAADNNATVVAELEVWLDGGFSGALFDSCKVSGAGLARAGGGAAASGREKGSCRCRGAHSKRRQQQQELRRATGAAAPRWRRGRARAGPSKPLRPLHSPLQTPTQDVKFGAANLPAINFIGGGAKTPQAWLEFLGEVKDKRVPPIGSPFQINFNPNKTGDGAPPEGIAPAREELPACGDAALTCSCADCPVAPGCALVGGRGAQNWRYGQGPRGRGAAGGTVRCAGVARSPKQRPSHKAPRPPCGPSSPPQPPSGPPAGHRGCRAGAVTCWDLTLILSYIGLAFGVGGAFVYHRRAKSEADLEATLFGGRTRGLRQGPGASAARVASAAASVLRPHPGGRVRRARPPRPAPLSPLPARRRHRAAPQRGPAAGLPRRRRRQRLLRRLRRRRRGRRRQRRRRHGAAAGRRPLPLAGAQAADGIQGAREHASGVGSFRAVAAAAATWGVLWACCCGCRRKATLM
jgi:hypothetical protein